MKQFILIGHKKRQGKDTFAKALKEALGDAEIMSFADPMKEIIAELLGCTLEDLDEKKNLHVEYRDLLKTFGNGKMVDIFGETVWLDVLLSKAEKSDAQYIIVPDFRFEREYIEGSRTINIIKDHCDADKHVSETELDTWDYDIKVHNDGSVEDLQHFARTYAESLRIEKYMEDCFMDDYNHGNTKEHTITLNIHM